MGVAVATPFVPVLVAALHQTLPIVLIDAKLAEMVSAAALLLGLASAAISLALLRGCDTMLLAVLYAVASLLGLASAAISLALLPGCDTMLLAVPLAVAFLKGCLLYTSPSPRDRTRSRMPSSA